MMKEAELIGISQNIIKIKKLVKQVAETGLNTVVYGETGVGKELVVKSLYTKSNRFGKPFIKVNCAALPNTLLESEMFGYERGAFTGAYRRMRGKFDQADGGVLFLDEIGDMSLPLQSKLLHAIQDGQFTPLGSEQLVKSNVWLIAATNHNLNQDVESGKFRSDLYFRISEIKIWIEPLRNRPEDIPYLIDYYSERYAMQFSKKPLQTLSKRTIDRLCEYPWPGNVRELQNVLRRIVVLDENEDHIDKMLSTAPVKPVETIDNLRAGNPINVRRFLGQNGRELDLHSLSLKEIQKKASDWVENEIISYVLEKTGWNRTRASKILDISYKTLLTKIQELEITPRFLI
jgi:two-component system, NtrC family, response regulator AtoC